MRTRIKDEIVRGNLSVISQNLSTGAHTRYTGVASAGSGKYQSIYDVGPNPTVRGVTSCHRRGNRAWYQRYRVSDLFALNPVCILSCTCSSSACADIHTKATIDPAYAGTGTIFEYKPANRNYTQEAFGQFYGLPTKTDPKYTLNHGGVEDYPVQNPTYRNFALARAYGKLSSPDNDFGQIIGEAVKTAALLVSPFKMLHHLYRKCIKIQGRMVRTWNQETKQMDMLFKPHSPSSIRRHKDLFVADVRGNFLKHGYAVINQTANRWLEFRYGARPIMWTIDDLRAEIDKVTVHPAIGREQAAYLPKVQESTSMMTTYTTNASFYYTVEWTHRVLTATAAQVFFRQKAGTVGTDYLFDLGLHPMQSVSLAYELFPLSFMLDWFIDVDSWLAGLTPHPSRTYLGNCVSTKEIHEFTGRVVKVWNSQDSRLITGYRIKPYRITWERLRRTVNNPVPKFPVWNPNLVGISNTTDILAAIWQRMPFFQRKR